MNVDHLNEKGMQKAWQQIMSGLSEAEIPFEYQKYILADLIYNLDAADEEDIFGTEGWKHTFGVDQ